MYVTDTPVIDRMTNPGPMELLEPVREEFVVRMSDTYGLSCVNRFADELATRLAALA